MSESPLLRYVVLRHEGIPDPHFDLMFETAPGSPLATWRSAVWPLAEGQTELIHLPDHRRDYLDYEGSVSGDRGTVRRVHAGTHRVEQDHPILLIVRLDIEEVWRLFRGPKEACVQILRKTKKAT
jgi:hypothetical protein